jgi:FlgD Ig-like domain
LQRVLSTAALLGLLIATAAAFAITERLKLVKSPVYGTQVSKRLSPTCGCARGKARISVKLRHGDDVTLTILDERRHVVRTLAAGEFWPRGTVVFTWNGKTDSGLRAADGVYRPEIHLARQRRTILLPNPIVLDTRPPKVLEVKPSRDVISPDADKVGDSIRIHYKLNSAAHLLVYFDSKLVIRSRSHQAQGNVVFHGRDAAGVPLKAGTYTLTFGAVDLAGNLTPVSARRPLTIRVRYIQLVPDRVTVKKPGVRFAIGVDTDAPHYWWKLNGEHGVASGPVLRLRAPNTPGTYTIAVGERRYTYRATLVVGAAR